MLAAAMVAAGVAFHFPEVAESVFIACSFRNFTGLPCPGCGSTRAWVAFFHGDPLGGLAANPFAFVACGALPFLAVWRGASLVLASVSAPAVDALPASLAARVFISMWMIWAICRAVMMPV